MKHRTRTRTRTRTRHEVKIDDLLERVARGAHIVTIAVLALTLMYLTAHLVAIFLKGDP